MARLSGETLRRVREIPRERSLAPHLAPAPLGAVLEEAKLRGAMKRSSESGVASAPSMALLATDRRVAILKRRWSSGTKLQRLIGHVPLDRIRDVRVERRRTSMWPVTLWLAEAAPVTFMAFHRDDPEAFVNAVRSRLTDTPLQQFGLTGPSTPASQPSPFSHHREPTRRRLR